MKEVFMDASTWNDPKSFYLSFFHAVQAPEWHGHNFNALRDSIAGGEINGIEVPYCVVITNLLKMPPPAKQIAADFIDLLQELKSDGVPIELRTED